MSKLPRPDPWSQPLPAARPPADMAIHQLPTGSYSTRAQFAFSGGSFRDVRQFAATAVLVSHPAGDLLIDAGFGSHVADHVAMLARFERAPFTALQTVRQQLDTGGYDWSRLLGVLATHVHWDHVSGVEDLGVPIWLNSEELRYSVEDSHGAVFRTASAGLDIRRYALDGAPYLGFPASFDVHGDGSVVVAFAGGHTFGSVVVFVTLPTGHRHAFIGDVAWQLDGIDRPAERPWLMRKVADVDPAVVRERLLSSVALKDVMHIVPAHDLSAYEGIPTLTPRTTSHDAS